MRVGFIGAGRCGMSLARYFKHNGITVSGFASHRRPEEFSYMPETELAAQSDIIFITTNDGAIADVWKKIKTSDLHGKVLCHCSGAMTSGIFSGADPGYVCSVHPMLAFNSKHTDEAAIAKAFFTLEGGEAAIRIIGGLLDKTRNRYRVIGRRDKVKYHAAACFASNFAVAVCHKAELLLEECGFTPDEAHSALTPLMQGNMDNIIRFGTKRAVTGPAARRDMETIEKHLSVLEKDRELYSLLTKIIMEM